MALIEAKSKTYWGKYNMQTFKVEQEKTMRIITHYPETSDKEFECWEDG